MRWDGMEGDEERSRKLVLRCMGWRWRRYVIGGRTSHRSAEWIPPVVATDLQYGRQTVKAFREGMQQDLCRLTHVQPKYHHH